MALPFLRKLISQFTEHTAGAPANDDVLLFERASDNRFRSWKWSSMLALLVPRATGVTIVGQHQFAPGSVQAPYTLGANAQGQKVTGLNADQLDGLDSADLRPLKLSAVADSSAVANTTTETIVGTYTIAADALAAGTVVRVRALGVHSTTGTPTAAIRIRIGGIGGAVVYNRSCTCGSGVSGNTWSLDLSFSCRTTGSGGTAQRGPALGYFEGGTPDLVPQDAAGTVGVNTTISNDLVITWQWGTASSSNTATRQSFAVELVPPLATS